MAESATSVGSLTFLGLFAMFSLSPRFTFYASRRVLRERPSQARSRSRAPCRSRKRDAWSACPLHPETSYWLGDANEMVPINTILIIVNSTAPQDLTVPQNFGSEPRIETTLRQKQGELAAGTRNVPLTISVIG